MAVPTTRELNVKVIFFVTAVTVMLLVTTIFSARAGYHFFKNRQVEQQYANSAQKTYEATGLRMDNLDLAKFEKTQTQDLQRDGKIDVLNAKGEVTGQVTMQPIDAAMQAIAQRY